MSKLVNLHKKNDPLKDWEDKDFRRRKKSNISYKEEQKAHSTSKPKVYNSPQEIARIAEILATKDEIRKSLASRVLYTNSQESAEIEKRKKELLNVKKILQM
jgi:hypothetical protein